MSALKRRIAAVVTALGVGAGIFVAASPAYANIIDCDVFPSGSHGVTAYCSGSSPSKFRAWANCHDYATGANSQVLGIWRTAGAGVWSSATCPSVTAWVRTSFGVQAAP